MDKDDDRSMNLKQATVVPEASELVRRYSDEPYSNVHHQRQYYNISPQSSVGPKELLESQSSNGDQPLDFSRKSSSVRRVPLPIAPVRREIISPISPARSEPPSQFLSYGDKYPKVVSIGHSPQSDGSGDDGHFVSHPDSVGVFSPDVAARVNHNRMEAYRLQALYHETFQNHETNLSALNTAGLLTTVPAMAPQNTRQASGEVPHKKPKYTRPFKAYPRDTHSIAAAAAAAASMGFYNGIHIPGQISLSPVNHMSNAANDPAFLQFRQEMLAARQADSQRKQRHSGEIHSEGSNDSDHKSSIVASSSVNEGLMNYNARISADSQDNSACSIDTKMCNNVGTASNSHSPDPVNRDNGNNGHGIVPMIMNGQMPNSSRKRSRALPDDLKDEAYWERRRKNNEAAKRSRDARRAKEDEIAIRAAYLERENLRLRLEVQTLRKELMEIRHMIYANERRPNS